jgi:two-component system, NarL family, nitrate/nitrite response regulator NarL
VERQRLLLADDHALFRDGLARLFAYEEDFDVVGQADSATSAIEAAQRLQPDLVLMDVDMPGGGGIAAHRHVHAA